MRKNGHSLTAGKVAMMRAAHQVFDYPKVLDDPIALKIIGSQANSQIHSQKRKLNTRIQRTLRASVVARSRFAEDELSAAVQKGVRQYVILGAGLDTFAYRNPYSSIGMKVFEIDHPATQEWKRRQLDAAKIPIPETLTFVAVDFEKQSLTGQLHDAGFSTNEPTFFSWLGVTMYLSRDTMMAMMEYICSSTPSGSEIVFDYVTPPSSMKFLHRLVFLLLARRLSNAEEPWVNFLDPGSLVADLTTMGFAQIEDVGPEKINGRHFTNRTDGLRAGSSGHIIKASV